MARDPIGTQPIPLGGDFNPPVRRAMVVAVSPRIRRSSLVVLGCAVGVLVLLIAAWAIDTGVHSGGVMRNVSLDGQAVGGLAQSDLVMVVERAGCGQRRPHGPDRDTHRQPRDDRRRPRPRDRRQATEAAALDAGRGDSVPLRPFAWFGGCSRTERVDRVRGRRRDHELGDERAGRGQPHRAQGARDPRRRRSGRGHAR